MPKVTILGAGSFFTKTLVTDILNIPSLDSGSFALVDIDDERLDLSYKLVRKIIKFSGKNWTVDASTERKELLSKSDYIINTIEVSGADTVRYDHEIPMKYGVKQCIGDTIGPGGIFKALRTIPVWIEILRDIERLCPDAIVMNYTNPMSMMMLATEKVCSLRAVGLCHSVQNSSKDLARYLEVPYEELHWKCGGINHMSWFTELSYKSKDMYPVLIEKCKDAEFYEQDPVRFEVMLHFGAFVTESSGHFSEYVPYFRKRDELIEKYCREVYLGETGFYANNWPKWRKEYDDKIRRLVNDEEGIDFTRSHEFASVIIQAVETGTPAVIHGNVRNSGLIDNLPFDGIVEVPCLIDRSGVNPCHFGPLPPQLAALNRSNMAVYELLVDAILEEDRNRAVQALMLDPLTSAVCSLSEIREMFDELVEAEKDYLPGWLSS